MEDEINDISIPTELFICPINTISTVEQKSVSAQNQQRAANKKQTNNAKKAAQSKYIRVYTTVDVKNYKNRSNKKHSKLDEI